MVHTSPLQAYADNKLKVLGNVELARQIIKVLSDGTGNQANICLLVEDSWTIDDEFGNGSLTLTGELFSPEGTVEFDIRLGRRRLSAVCDRGFVGHIHRHTV